MNKIFVTFLFFVCIFFLQLVQLSNGINIANKDRKIMKLKAEQQLTILNEQEQKNLFRRNLGHGWIEKKIKKLAKNKKSKEKKKKIDQKQQIAKENQEFKQKVEKILKEKQQEPLHQQQQLDDNNNMNQKDQIFPYEKLTDNVVNNKNPIEKFNQVLNQTQNMGNQISLQNEESEENQIEKQTVNEIQDYKNKNSGKKQKNSEEKEDLKFEDFEVWHLGVVVFLLLALFNIYYLYCKREDRDWGYVQPQEQQQQLNQQQQIQQVQLQQVGYSLQVQQNDNPNLQNEQNRDDDYQILQSQNSVQEGNRMENELSMVDSKVREYDEETARVNAS